MRGSMRLVNEPHNAEQIKERVLSTQILKVKQSITTKLTIRNRTLGLQSFV